MLTTASMGLTVWDQETDDFDPSQLAANWEAIDSHDHSASQGVQIGTSGIQASAITQALLAANSVGNNQLQPQSITAANIQASQISSALIAGNAVGSAQIANGAVGATELDPTITPLGTIVQWWRPSGSSAVPGGFWELMDGRPWHTITNAWGLTTGNIPDTRNLFTLGADILGEAGPYIGTYGGSSSVTLSHSHTVPEHFHPVPPHDHPIIIDGQHYHSWLGGLDIWARANVFDIGLTVENWVGEQYTNQLYSLYINNMFSNPGWNSGLLDGISNMDPEGAHNHGGATNLCDVFDSDFCDPFFTDVQLVEEIDIVPPNISFCQMMRVR